MSTTGRTGAGGKIGRKWIGGNCLRLIPLCMFPEMFIGVIKVAFIISTPHDYCEILVFIAFFSNRQIEFLLLQV